MSTDKNTANFPGPNVPIDQAGESIISQPWLQFFLALLNRTGGNGTPSSDTAALLAAIQAVQAQADYQSVVMQDPATQEALRRIAELAAEMLPTVNVRSLLTRLDDIEAGRLDSVTPDFRAITARLEEIEGRFLDRVTPPIPSPQEPWNAPTLANSWVYYGSPYSTPGYFKDANGIVHVRGVVKSGTVGSAIFTLPAGYCPEFRLMYPTASFSISADAYGRVDVDTNGNVLPIAGTNSYFSMDVIKFRAV